MSRSWGIAVVAACALNACGKTPAPLLSPLPATRQLPGAVHLVLLDADLPQLAETVRTLAGKSVDVAAGPWSVPNWPGHGVGALSGLLEIGAGQAAWTTTSRLRLDFALTKVVLPAALTAPGQAACGMTWVGTDGHVHLEVHVVRDAQGAVGVKLATDPAVTWQTQQLVDGEACLQQAPVGSGAAIVAHVADTVRAALAPRLAQAALHALAAVFPDRLEVAGRVGIATRWGKDVEMRFSARYDPIAGVGEAVASHEGARASAALTLGLDVDRAACAADVPPPQQEPQPLPPQSPAPPPGSAFLRRALVLDRAALGHIGWLIARTGSLCQDVVVGLPGLGAGWASNVKPELAEWVEGPPVGARFWPAASAEVRAIDTADGPALEWRIAASRLEIVARVADTDMVVLSMTGGLRAIVRPVVTAGQGLSFHVLSTARESTIVTSPLLGDAIADGEGGVGPLVDAALRGIFQATPVLPLGLMLPEGTVATGWSRAGDALWLWLEGGAAP